MAIGQFSIVSGSTCTATEIDFGLCSIGSSTTDSSVILDATIDGAEPAGDTGSWSDGFTDEAAGEAECVRSTIEPDRCFRDPPNPSEPAPVVTMTDVAVFSPTFASATGEPSGWAIVGLPVNLIGPSGPVVVGGTLLGSAADVRFTPVEWRWDHGDGTSAVVEVPGAPWSTIGVPEFSATATSHVFRTAGVHRISLQVVVVADYRIAGGPWIPVAGSLTLPVAGFDVVVASADTVLVDRDCERAPVGPGC